jgi:glutamyl-tRNA synthetase
MKIKTRFAPSPTGHLHLGGARTALFNWLFARAHQGTFILRIEDTDIARSTESSTQGIFDSLKWLGLDWDEEPYFQTKRVSIYFEYLEKLYRSGFIYPAFETKEILADMKQKAIDRNQAYYYDRASFYLSPQEIEQRINSEEEFVWRFNSKKFDEVIVPEQLMANGSYHVKADTLDDFIITRPGTKKNPGMPLYNFVCALDDVLMEITHVIRGVEHLPNAAKQVMIQQALGYTPPKFLHLPLIMKNGKKMSKREIDLDNRFPVSVGERCALGYLPESTLNQIALLGWSPSDGKEIFDLNTLQRNFTLERLSKASANFDEERFFFLNSYYIKNMDDDILLKKVMPFLKKSNINVEKFDEEMLKEIVTMEKGQCRLLSDFPKEIAYCFEFPAEKIFKNNNDPLTLNIIEEAIEAFEKTNDFSLKTIENLLKGISSKLDLPFSKVGPVLRLNITGKTKSASLAKIINILGKQEILKRLKYAKEYFKKMGRTSETTQTTQAQDTFFLQEVFRFV